MIPDLDIYRSAQLLIDNHGTEAPIHAAMNADAMLAKGDMDGRAMWPALRRLLLLVTEVRAGGQRLVDFCHPPGASQHLLAAALRLPSPRTSQHVPVHAVRW